MSKVNKVKIGLVILFIILLVSYTFVKSTKATENNETVEIEEDSTANGGGMEDNPFIIDGKTTVTYTALPFYFQVTSEGSYEIEHDVGNQKVTFTPVKSQSINSDGTTSIKVVYDRVGYSSLDNYQLGVTPEDGGDSAQAPVHSIEEVSYYYSWLGLTDPGDYMGDNVEESSDGGYSIVSRHVKLYNVKNESSSSSAYAGRSNLYYFATSKNKNNVKNLFTPLLYVDDDNNGEWITLKNTSYLSEDMPDYEKDKYKQTVTIPSSSNSLVPSSEAAVIMYRFNGNDTALDTENVSTIERILTYIATTIGDVLLSAIQSILGEDLSITSLVFNQYENTKIDFYNQGSSGISQVVKNVVNNWFNIFISITYVGYIIILIYIGIKAIMSAGTEKQSKIKSYFGNWVMGLLILTIFPTVGIRLIVQMNEAFVKYMSKGRGEIKSYYNYYEEDKKNDILGSDSATISIEELLGLKQSKEQELAGTRSEIEKIVSNLSDKVISRIEARGESLTDSEKEMIKKLINGVYYNLKNTSRGETIDESDITSAIAVAQDSLRWQENVSIRGEVSNIIGSAEMKELMRNEFQEAIELEGELDYLNERIEVAKTDFMGIMRGYAGHYHRLIYAVLWWVLLFQFIGLIFLYFKRVFVIAILIAVFPIIMLFYCIDKMSDGAAQTLRLWVKELLANIFVQSVHAVIYTILIEMGMNIYNADTTNWIFFVAAMLLLLPAETIMKEIFDLNGSTVRQVGGMLGKAALLTSATLGFAKAAKGGNDRSIQEKREARFNKLQNKQNRADMKAEKRQANELRKNPGNLNEDGSVKLTGVRAAREKLYHAGTNVRQFKNDVANNKGVRAAVGVAREVKNVAAISAGIAYGLAGGDAESMMQGSQIAAGLTGKTENVKKSEKKDVKHELKAAYDRKKKNS